MHPSVRHDNPWFREYWSLYFSCTWNSSEHTNKPCNDDWRASKENGFDVHTHTTDLIDSINTFAYALDALIKDHGHKCPDISGVLLNNIRDCVNGPLLMKYLKKTSFHGIGGLRSFDANGDPIIGIYDIEQVRPRADRGFNLVMIGSWSSESNATILNQPITWYLGSFNGNTSNDSIPESVCSKPCDPGYYYVQKELHCCWECKPCVANEILINITTCSACPTKTWPDQETRTKCLDIYPKYLRWTDSIAVVLLILALLGITCSLINAVFFIRHRNERLIKACSRELMIVILTGIFLGYFTVILSIIKPADEVCIIRYVTFEMSFTCLFAPVLTRANRIFRIFDASRLSRLPPKMISPLAQLIIAGTIIFVQVSVHYTVKLFHTTYISENFSCCMSM